MLERCRIEPQEIPGRGLCVVDKRILEFQTALAFDGEKEIQRVEQMRDFRRRNSRLYPDARVKPIPEVPEVIPFEKLRQEEKNLFEQPSQMPAGLDYNSVEYLMMHLASMGFLAVRRREQSEPPNYLRSLSSVLSAA